jgi:hypothetical protein
MDKKKPEKKFLFSQSPIWELQNRYFQEAHIHAWSNGEVPHYITSNPRTAVAYAEVILAFLRDRQIHQDNEPIYILELGAGSARFSYHLLKTLCEQYERLSGLKQSFVYIISDYVEKNLEYWKDHPRLIPYFENGLLDMARFDAEKDTSIHLRFRDQVISKNSLSQPLFVISNYFFDSIPQELFYFHNGVVKNVYTEITDDKKTGPKHNINVSVEYSYVPLKQFPFTDEIQLRIAESYRSLIQKSHLLFPHAGMTCISRLYELSTKGLLLLTADKGSHRLEDIENKPLPTLIRHGSFSLNANYHALKLQCEEMKGTALFPKHPYSHINIGCLLYLADHATYPETKAAYERAINTFGPDEYFSIKKHIEKQVPILSIEELFAYLRLSAYDSRLFTQFLPGFYSKLSLFREEDRYTFLQAAAKVWEGYYPIKEESNLAFSIAVLLFELKFYEEALSFFGLSEKIYGANSDVSYNKAVCYMQLNRPEDAIPLIEDLLIQLPENQDVQTLAESLSRH